MDKEFDTPENAARRERSKDTGMAMVLICLILAYFRQHQGFLAAAIILLVIVMTWPTFFYYPSRLWFGLAHLMGTFVSKIVLTVLFFSLVMPIGVLRRMFGADPMRIKQWKNGKASVFETRDHLYQAQDIENPY